MNTHNMVLNLLDEASDCLESMTLRIRDANEPSRHRLFLPSNERDFKSALLPFSIIFEKGRVPIRFDSDYTTSLTELGDLWHKLLNEISRQLTPLATPLLDEARSAVDEAISRFDSIMHSKAKLGRDQYKRLCNSLEAISVHWAKMETTSGHPELTPAEVQMYTLKLPDGSVGILNEYSRKNIVDLDHREHNFSTGHIRLKKVDLTFVISLKAIEIWKVLFQLLTNAEVHADGSVVIEKRINKDGKPIPVLDCFKTDKTKTNGAWALRKYIVNVSSVNSAGGRTGRKTDNLFRIDPVNGPKLNSETTLRRKKVMKRQRPKKSPSI